MNLEELRRVVDAEGRRLAIVLLGNGLTADEAAELFSDTDDAEPWIAVAYMREWETGSSSAG